jgi:D-glycero-D-manno-heptose 1,7-bisphosphate phosphatase
VNTRPVVFLDRDGVLNEFVVDPATGLADSPFKVEDVKLIAGAARAAARLADAGFTLVCVSNQPAAAKAKASIEQLLAVHRRVAELLAGEGAELATSRLCWHHPEGVLPELTGRCACRKPEPGMLLEAAAEVGADLGASWMVGDTDTDVAAGRAAGCRTVLLEYAHTAHKRLSHAHPDLRAADLRDAVGQLLTSSNQRHFPKSPFASLRAR